MWPCAKHETDSQLFEAVCRNLHDEQMAARALQTDAECIKVLAISEAAPGAPAPHALDRRQEGVEGRAARRARWGTRYAMLATDKSLTVSQVVNFSEHRGDDLCLNAEEVIYVL